MSTMEFSPKKKAEENIANQSGKENFSLEAYRRKMWQALTVSLALVLQACGPTRQEIDAMPTTKVEDINKYGKELAERPVIKVKGYVQDLGEKGEEVERFFFAKKEITTHNYILRSALDAKSSSVGMIAVGESTEGFVRSIPPSFPQFKPGHQYELLGEVVGVAKDKKVEYVLQIYLHSGAFDLTAAKPEKEK